MHCLRQILKFWNIIPMWIFTGGGMLFKKGFLISYKYCTNFKTLVIYEAVLQSKRKYL